MHPLVSKCNNYCTFVQFLRPLILRNINWRVPEHTSHHKQIQHSFISIDHSHHKFRRQSSNYFKCLFIYFLILYNCHNAYKGRGWEKEQNQNKNQIQKRHSLMELPQNIILTNTSESGIRGQWVGKVKKRLWECDIVDICVLMKGSGGGIS